MPILLIILVAILIAQVGFWDTLGAILGATLMIILFVLILIVAAVIAVGMMLRRMRGRR